MSVPSSSFPRLAQILCDTLSVPEVAPEDGFFDIGGHSLAAVQAVERINAEFDVKIALRDFFGFASLADLATEIDRQRAGAGAGARMAARDDDDPVFEGEI